MFPLLRALAVTAGRAAFRRSAPFYFAVLIAAGIAFGGNGMDAADLTGLLRRSPGLRVTFWALWLIGSGPAVQALLGEPRLLFLRSLPVSRTRVLAAHTLLLLLAELPWVALFTRGDGGLAGLAVAVGALALHCLWTARPLSRRQPMAALLGIPVIVAIAIAASPVVLLLAALACLSLALPQAYIAAPERVSQTSLSFLSPRVSPSLALALAYLALLFRGQRVLLLRCLLLCLLPAGIAYLAIANNQVTTIELQNTLALGTLAVPLLLSLCSLAAAIVRGESQLAWLLATAGQGGSRRVLAVLLTLALLATLLATPPSLLLVWGLKLPLLAGLRVFAAALSLAWALAAVAQGLLRLTARSTASDNDRLLIALLAICGLGILSCWLLHEAVVLAWLLLGVVLTERSLVELDPGGRHARLRRERALRAGDDV